MTRHLLDVDDLDSAELATILDLSERSTLGAPLAGRGVALLFEKPSARTRTSMEMAVMQLGGHPLSLSDAEVGIDRRESAEDLARLFSSMTAAIGARVFEHSKLERMADVASVPVLNLLSDEAHPLQTLADLLTLRQIRGSLGGAVVGFVGDANNVARSLALGCALSGVELRISTPPGYGFTDVDLERIGSCGAVPTTLEDPREAVQGADVVYTDTWYSMGQESEKESRRDAFARWRVNDDLMRCAGVDAVFMHCLPAHRGDEVTATVIDGASSRVWLQAENRMHTARGVIAWMEGVR